MFCVIMINSGPLGGDAGRVFICNNGGLDGWRRSVHYLDTFGKVLFF